MGYFKRSLIFFLSLIFLAGNSFAQSKLDEKHVEVTMRMMGHQILLQSGDSSSRVLPIHKEGNRYKIEFSSDFTFEPKDQVIILNKIVQNAGISKGYFLEVEDCTNGEVVYNYEIKNLAEFDDKKTIVLDTVLDFSNLSEPNIIPCSTRKYPTGCYIVFITLIHPFRAELDSAANMQGKSENPKKVLFGPLFGLIAVLGGMYFFLRKKKQPEKNNPNIIHIGEFQYNKIHSELSLKDQKVELSAKEADLLLLLYNSANTTVERDEILKQVWGDEGDYIGRTLDVFISKLRKKLEIDTKVKIVNIRGVGYKLVLDPVSRL